ncbi:YcxB family protein [Caproiciproducens sp. CPB-2]|uniref:YcxB family protein n=1 Tax=Caproiciproducens sp. CPB-2 TaxID=3030017 RepID=UPI0023DCAA13|nr:YcxB family protein [Caproiciproducens sp. CPB-2]MDF1494725.1 YcxB family protein [Caproiciproducens sp. CPB-2]
MPTFYEGGPVDTVEQTVGPDEYAAAYYTAQSAVSPIHTKWVRAGICLSAAIVIASFIPFYRARFFTCWGPACGIVLALALAFLFFFIQPDDTRKWAAELYRSNRLLALPQKIEIFRDSVVIQSSCEKMLEYWTDFSKCIETPSAFVVTGGRERDLLIIKKQGLTNEQIEKISAHLAGAFASRYLKSGR